MKRMIATALLAAIALTGLIRAVKAQEKEEPIDPRILAYDKGPAKIDVSKYPADMQAKYKVFAKKCSNCHTIARAINSEFALDDEWERYVKRMMRKAGTLITPDEGKQIYEFVTYDSKIRKKTLYEKKLAAQK
ncbi:MAG: hypothetical protein ACHQO8_06530 [Vicinamibacterales bacterium]